MTETAEETKTQRRFTRVGIAGLVIGLLALIAAVLSPWIIALAEPEKKPIDEVAAETAVKIKDRIAAKLRGEEYVAPADSDRTGANASRLVPMSVIGAGILAACIGVVGFIRHDNARLSSATIGVGAAAVVFQYFLLLAGAILLIVLIAAVLAMLDGSA